MEKNYTLNFVKFIACVFVVLIHIKFPGNIGLYISCLARFAVPFFFMISGYYSYKVINTKNHVKKHIIKILKISIIATISYFIFNILYYYYYHENKNLIETFFTFDNLKYFIFFNQINFAGHLWFLYALLYNYLIYYIAYKKKKVLYFLIPILLSINIIIGIRINLFGLNYKNFVIRNFMFVGLPFFMIGNFINKYKTKILKLFSNTFLICIIIISSITSIIECVYIGYLDLHISTIFLTISIFLWCILNPNFIKKNNLIAIFGEKYSLGIYLSHLMLITIIKNIIPSELLDNNILNYVLPIFIIFISLLLNIFYYKIKYKFFKKYN